MEVTLAYPHVNVVLSVLALISCLVLMLVIRMRRRLSSRSSSSDIEQGKADDFDLYTTLPPVDNSSSEAALISSKNYSYNSNSGSQAIPIPERVAEIPQVVQPLTPPREVVRMKDIHRILSLEEKYDAFMLRVRVMQDLLKPEGKATLKSKMVIGVHAKPDCLAGYMVNVKERTCQIYTYDVESFPSSFTHWENEVELGAKNLMFALILWQPDIQEAKRVRLYVGNNDVVKSENCESVMKLRSLLRHFQKCQKVVFNSIDDMCLSSENDANDCERTEDDFDIGGLYIRYRDEELQKLVKFIQPALDLADKKVKTSQRHLQNLFDINQEDVFKTHEELKWIRHNPGQHIKKTTAFRNFLERMEKHHLKLRKPCPQCNLIMDSVG